MKITLKHLEEIDACTPAREWFAATFPDGAEITADNLSLCHKPEWVCWLACYHSPEYRYWCAGWAMEWTGNEDLREFWQNVTPDNVKRAISAAADAAYAAASADAAYAAYTSASAAAYAAYTYAYAAAASAAASASASAYAAYTYAYAYAYKILRAEADRVLLSL